MVNVTEEWLARGNLGSQWIELNTPITIRQMIERQFDHLPPEEQQVPDVASMAGMDFCEVAARIEAGVPEVEERWANLVRREHFLQGGETPPLSPVLEELRAFHISRGGYKRGGSRQIRSCIW